MNQIEIQIQVNYLGPNIEASDIQAILDTGQSTSTLICQRSVLEGFLDLPLSCIGPEVLQRYVEATSGLHKMAFPASEQIHTRLLMPLRSAKKNYCFGDYLATVAASGVAAEMIAVLIWIINIEKLKDHQLTENDREDYPEFGCTSERRGQAERVEVLKKAGLISSEDKSEFSAIRELRKRYLHWWSIDLHKEKDDALKAYSKAFNLFRKFVPLTIGDGGVLVFDPRLLEFL